MISRWVPWAWVALAVFQLLSALANLFAGHHDSAWTAFCFAGVNGYIASLLFEKRRAQQFRDMVLSPKRYGRWVA